MKYIFLDDIEEIVNIVGANITNCNCIYIDVKKKNLFDRVQQLFDENKEDESITIITDYGIKVAENEYQNIFDYFLDSFLNEENSQKVYEIIVYSYQFEIVSTARFNIETRKRVSRLGKNKENRDKLIPKLTSATFVRSKGLYVKQKLNKSELKPYSTYLSELVRIIISSNDNDVAKEVRDEIFSKKNLSLETWLWQSNFFFPTYFIGTISYIAPKEYGMKYAFDVPFKTYYSEMNKILDSEGYTEFLENKDKIAKNFSWIYLKIKRTNTTLKVKVILQDFLKNLSSEHPFNVNVDVEQRDFWIISLYAAIFYQVDVQYNDQKYKTWNVEIVDTFNEDDELVEIYWFYHQNHYEFLPKKGFLNFTLYRQTAPKSINKEIEKSLLPEESFIERTAEELYETNYNLIESKVLETLVPYYTEGMKQKSNLNAISSIVVYNMTHTDGSHTIIDTERFLKALRSKIKGSPRCNCERKNCLICNLDLLHNKQTTAYNEQLRLIMETSDALSQGFTGNSYFAYNLIDVLKYWNENYFSKLTKGLIGKPDVLEENFLGRGLNDGTANSVISIDRNTEKDVLFPLGDLGTTALLIILKNIFRNLKKHSRSLLKRDLSNLFIKINNNIQSKPIYKIEIKLTQLDSESMLYEDYFKIECIERSNSYTFNKADNIIQELNTEFQKRFEAEEMGSGWGLKEMKIFSSFLIGYPLYESISKLNKDEEFVEYEGIKYPSEIIKAVKIECKDHSCKICNVYSCEQCKKSKEKCEKCKAKKYHISHEFYIKKPKYATLLRNEEGLPKILNKGYLDKGFVIKDKKVTNLQSPSHFVLGYNGTKTKPKINTRKHNNFRVIEQAFQFDFENVNKVQKAIENNWITKMNYQEFDLCETSIDGEFRNINTGESSDFKSLQNKKSIAIIDDHVRLIKSKWNETNCTQQTLDYFLEFGYYEEQSNSCKSRRFYDPNSKTPKYLQVESLNIHVGIWDERIQKHLQESKHNIIKGIELQKIYELKHIYTPIIISLFYFVFFF